MQAITAYSIEITQNLCRNKGKIGVCSFLIDLNKFNGSFNARYCLFNIIAIFNNYFVFKIHEANWDGRVEIILRDRSKFLYHIIVSYFIL